MLPLSRTDHSFHIFLVCWAKIFAEMNTCWLFCVPLEISDQFFPFKSRLFMCFFFGSRLSVAVLLLRLLAHLPPWILGYDPSKPSIRMPLDAVGPITTFPILLLVSQMHRCATRPAFDFRFPTNIILESRIRSYRNKSWQTLLTSGRKNE